MIPLEGSLAVYIMFRFFYFDLFYRRGMHVYTSFYNIVSVFVLFGKEMLNLDLIKQDYIKLPIVSNILDKTDVM